MEPTQIFIIVAIVVLAIVAAFFLFVIRKRKEKMSQLASIAIAFVLLGIIFGGNVIVGYGLMGVGVVLAIIDIIQKERKKKQGA